MYTELYGLQFWSIYLRYLFNFFFVPRDLIDKIDSYYKRAAVQRNLLLIDF